MQDKIIMNMDKLKVGIICTGVIFDLNILGYSNII